MDDRYGRLLADATIIRGSTDSDLRRTINMVEPQIIINLAALPLAVTAVQNSEKLSKAYVVQHTMLWKYFVITLKSKNMSIFLQA